MDSPGGDLYDEAVFIMATCLNSFFESLENLSVGVTAEKIHLVSFEQKFSFDFAVYEEHNCLYIATLIQKIALIDTKDLISIKTYSKSLRLKLMPA